MAQLKSEISNLYQDFEENFQVSNASNYTTASEEDLNLFDDFIISKENEKKLEKERHLKEQSAKTEAEMQNLMEKCNKLEEDNKTLIWNISSLWKTSIAQMREKDTKIRRLQKENESIIFKKAMRHIPRDELDRIVSRIASYHKDEFAEFMESLRSQALMQHSPRSEQVSSYWRAPSKTAREIRDVVVGTRIMRKGNTEATHLQRLMGLGHPKSDDLEGHSRNHMKIEPDNNQGENEHMKKQTSKRKAGDSEKPRALLKEFKCEGGEVTTGIPTEPQPHSETTGNQSLDHIVSSGMMKTIKCENNYNLYPLVDSPKCPIPRDGVSSSMNMIYSILYGQNKTKGVNEGSSSLTSQLGVKVMPRDPRLRKLLPLNTHELSFDEDSTSKNVNQKALYHISKETGHPQDELSDTISRSDNLGALNECSMNGVERRTHSQKFGLKVLDIPRNELGKNENLKVMNSCKNSVTNDHSFQNSSKATLYSLQNYEDSKNRQNYLENGMDEKVDSTENSSRRSQHSWKDTNKGANQLTNELDKHNNRARSNTEDVDQASGSLDKRSSQYRWDTDRNSDWLTEKSDKRTSRSRSIADNVNGSTEESDKRTSRCRSNVDNVDRATEESDKQTSQSGNNDDNLYRSTEESKKQTSRSRSNADNVNQATEESDKKNSQSRSNDDNFDHSTGESEKRTSRSKSNADNVDWSMEESKKLISRSRSKTARNSDLSTEKSDKRTSHSRSNADNVDMSMEKSKKRTSQSRSNGDNFDQSTEESKKLISRSRSKSESNKRSRSIIDINSDQSTEKSDKQTSQSRSNTDRNSNQSTEKSDKQSSRSRSNADNIDRSTEKSIKQSNRSRSNADNVDQATEESDKRTRQSRSNGDNFDRSTEESDTRTSRSRSNANNVDWATEESDKRTSRSRSNADNVDRPTEESDKQTIRSRSNADNVDRVTEESDKQTTQTGSNTDRNSDRSTEDSDKRASPFRSNANNVDRSTEEWDKRTCRSRSNANNVDRSTEESDKRTRRSRSNVDNVDRATGESDKQTSRSRSNANNVDRSTEESNKRTSRSRSNADNVDRRTEESDKQTIRSRSNADNVDLVTEESDKRTCRSRSNANNVDRSTEKSDKRTSRSRSNADNVDRPTEESDKQPIRSRSNADNVDLVTEESDKRTCRSRSNANNVDRSTEKSDKRTSRSRSNADNFDRPTEESDKQPIRSRSNADNVDQVTEESDKETIRSRSNVHNVDRSTEGHDKRTSQSRSNFDNVDRSTEESDKRTCRSRSNADNVDRSTEEFDKRTSRSRSNVDWSTDGSDKRTSRSRSNADNVDRSTEEYDKRTSRSRSNADNVDQPTEESDKQTIRSRSNADNVDLVTEEFDKRTCRSRSNADNVDQVTEESDKETIRSRSNVHNVDRSTEGHDKRTSQSRSNFDNVDRSTEESDKRTCRSRSNADNVDRSTEEFDKRTSRSRSNVDWSTDGSDKRTSRSRSNADNVDRSTEEYDKRTSRSRSNVDNVDRATEESDKQTIRSRSNADNVDLVTEESDKRTCRSRSNADNVDQVTEESDKETIRSRSNVHNVDRSTEGHDKRTSQSRSNFDNVYRATEEFDKQTTQTGSNTDRNSYRSTEDSDKRTSPFRSNANNVDRSTEESDKRTCRSRSNADNVDRSTEEYDKRTSRSRSNVDNVDRATGESDKQTSRSRSNANNVDRSTEKSNKRTSRSRSNDDNLDWATESSDKGAIQSRRDTDRNSDRSTEESDKRTCCCRRFTDKNAHPSHEIGSSRKYTKISASTNNANENRNEHKYKDLVRSSVRSDKEKALSCKSEARRERDLSLSEDDDRTRNQLHAKCSSNFPRKRTAQDIFHNFVPENRRVTHPPLDIRSWKIPKKNPATLREGKAKWHGTTRGKFAPSNFIRERRFISDRWKGRYISSFKERRQARIHSFKFSAKYGRGNDSRRLLTRSNRNWASRQPSPQRRKSSEICSSHYTRESLYVSERTFRQSPPCKTLRETRLHGQIEPNPCKKTPTTTSTPKVNQDDEVSKQHPSHDDCRSVDIETRTPERRASSASSSCSGLDRWNTEKRKCESKDEKGEAKENKTNLNIQMAELEEGEIADDSRLSFDLSNEQEAILPQNLLTKDKLGRKILKETIARDNFPMEDTATESNAEISSKEKLSTEEPRLNDHSHVSSKPPEPILDKFNSDKKYLEMKPNHSFSVPSLSSLMNNPQKSYSIQDNATEETFDSFMIRYRKNNPESISLQNDDSEMSLLQFISPAVGSKCSSNTNVCIAVSPQPFHFPSQSPTKFTLSPCPQKNSPQTNLFSPVLKKQLLADLSVSADNGVAVERLSCNEKLLDLKSKCATPDKSTIESYWGQGASPIRSSFSKSEHMLPTSTSSHFQYSLSGFHVQETPSKMLSPSCSPISLATPLDSAKDLTDNHTPPPLSSTLKISTPVIALDLDRKPRFPLRVSSASFERVASERSERRRNLSSSNSTKEGILKENGGNTLKNDSVSFNPELKDGGKTRERLCDNEKALVVSEFNDTLKKVGCLNPPTIPKKKVPFYTISREVSRGENSFCQGDHYKDFGFASSFYKNLDRFEEGWPKHTKYTHSNYRVEARPTTPTPSHQQPIPSSYEASSLAVSHSNSNNNSANSNSSTTASSSSSSSSCTSSSTSSNTSSDSSSSGCSTCNEGDSQTHIISLPSENLEVGSDLLATSFTTPLSESHKTTHIAGTESDKASSLAENRITTRSLSKEIPDRRRKVNKNDSAELKRNCNKSPAKETKVHKNGFPKPKVGKRRRIQPIPVTEETHSSSVLFTLPSLSPEKASPSADFSPSNPVSCPLPSLSPEKTSPSTDFYRANLDSCLSDEGSPETTSVSQETASVTKTLPEKFKKNEQDTILPTQMTPSSAKIPAEASTSTLFGNIEDLSNSQLSLSRLFGDREYNIEGAQVCDEFSLNTREQREEPVTPVSSRPSGLILSSRSHSASEARSSESFLSSAMPSLHCSRNDTVRSAVKSTKFIKVLTPNSVILRQTRKRTRNCLSPSTTTSVFSIVYRGDNNQDERDASRLCHGDSPADSKDEMTLVPNLTANLPKKRKLGGAPSFNETKKGLEAKSDPIDRALQENTSSLFNPRQVFRRPIRRRNPNLTPTKRNDVPKR